MLKDEIQYLRDMNAETMREEALEGQRQQDAEYLLFKYLMASACRSDTPLSITRSMARYLGRELPEASGQLLSVAMPSEGGNPAVQLMQFAAILGPMNIPPDSEGESPDLDDGDRWISVVVPEISLEERMRQLEEEKWRKPAGFSSAEQEEKPSPLRPLRLLVLALLLLGAAYMAHTHGCAPIKKYLPQGLFSVQEAETPPAASPPEPSPLPPATPSAPVQIWPEPAAPAR